MRCFVSVPTVVLGFAAIWTSAALSALEWTRITGLDFWNVGNEGVYLRGAMRRVEI